MAEYRFAFSYSRWSLWKKCPAAYKYKNIDKIREPDSPALIEGRKTHDAIATYIVGATDERPKAVRKFTTLVDGLRAERAANPRSVHVELQHAVDRDLRPVSWMGRNVWCRAVWDVLRERGPEADAIDWKTGKVYDSYEDQKQLFAIAAFWRNPKLEKVTGYWVYLDHEVVHDATFLREQIPQLTEVWMGNAAMMEADQAFLPKPSNDTCRFCNFSWKKGGPCNAGM